MSKKTDWILTWWRSVGEFKDGERRMLQRKFRPKAYKNLALAMKGRERYRQGVSAKGFIHRWGRKPRRITEIQINYPAE